MKKNFGECRNNGGLCHRSGSKNILTKLLEYHTIYLLLQSEAIRNAYNLAGITLQGYRVWIEMNAPGKSVEHTETPIYRCCG